MGSVNVATAVVVWVVAVVCVDGKAIIVLRIARGRPLWLVVQRLKTCMSD